MRLSTSTRSVVLTTALSILSYGCAYNSISYEPYLDVQSAPTEAATGLTGSVDQARTIGEQIDLPHHSTADQYALRLEWIYSIVDQMGSRDYVLLGQLEGGGNAFTDLTSLKDSMLERAAQEGGDAVLFFNEGVEARPYSFTTPGQSYTTTNISAYGSGNYATATGTSTTTYTPSRTYTGTNYFPYANGLVLKHVPGWDEHRQAILSLDPQALTNALEALDAVAQEPEATFEEYRSAFFAIK